MQAVEGSSSCAPNPVKIDITHTPLIRVGSLFDSQQCSEAPWGWLPLPRPVCVREGGAERVATMRSDDRFYFLMAAGLMTTSLVYTIFFHVLPELDSRHDYLYAHCTVTGDGHWEKYETVYGIMERVVVPVEVRIGTIEGALDWDGVNPLNSKDVYHQGIGRDKPSGWQYFTKEEKQDYLRTYKPGKEYECWMRPGSGTNEVVFHKKAITFRLIPEIIFCMIVFFLCVATGVCMVGLFGCNAIIYLDAAAFSCGLPRHSAQQHVSAFVPSSAHMPSGCRECLTS